MKEKDKSKQEIPPEFLELEKKFGLNSMKSNLTRGRSLVVGTQFNGCYEVGIRSDDGTYYYTIITERDLPALRNMFSLFSDKQCQEDSGN
jgi:hypothetical protein